MTFDDLDPTLRTHVEQWAFDAGCAWVEEFRDERGRDPEPEEADEEAANSAERFLPQVKRLLADRGVEADASLLSAVQRALRSQFVGALEV